MLAHCVPQFSQSFAQQDAAIHTRQRMPYTPQPEPLSDSSENEPVLSIWSFAATLKRRTAAAFGCKSDLPSDFT